VLEELTASLADRTLPRLLRYYAKFDLVIVDEFGFDRVERALSPEAASLLYKLINARSARRSPRLRENLTSRSVPVPQNNEKATQKVASGHPVHGQASRNLLAPSQGVAQQTDNSTDAEQVQGGGFRYVDGSNDAASACDPGCVPEREATIPGVDGHAPRLPVVNSG